MDYPMIIFTTYLWNCNSDESVGVWIDTVLEEIKENMKQNID